MLSDNSILRRLPALDREQLLFLDAVRHGAEIAHVGYVRLCAILTEMALEEDEEQNSRNRRWSMPAAFLDAWAIVDALYQMDGLFKLYPHKRPGDAPTLREAVAVFAAISRVRNVADHLGVKIDQIKAYRGAALGTLTWSTLRSTTQAVMCLLHPGTAHPTQQRMVNPLGKPHAVPTDNVTLRAGPHEVGLSQAMRTVARHIHVLETSIEEQLAAHQVAGSAAGADLFIKMYGEFSAGPAAVADKAVNRA